MSADLAVGNRFPDLVLPDHAGSERRLSELVADDPVLLQFCLLYTSPSPRDS